MSIRARAAPPSLPERALDVRRTLAAALAWAMCACGALAASALGRAGDLDHAFGVNGVARLAPFPETACADPRGLAIRRGGDIYISGTLGTAAAPAGDYLAAIHD